MSTSQEASDAEARPQSNDQSLTSESRRCKSAGTAHGSSFVAVTVCREVILKQVRALFACVHYRNTVGMHSMRGSIVQRCWTYTMLVHPDLECS